MYAAPTTPPMVEINKRGSSVSEFSGCGILLVILFILGSLSLYCVVENRYVDDPGANCRDEIRQVAIALLNYESENGNFPPAYIADENGKPMHSWRVLILPYLEQKSLYRQYRMDEPWDGPNNSKLHEEIVPQYRCPNSDSAQHCTDYALITGTGTAFDHDNTVNYGDIGDGSSNSILVAEVTGPGFHWMKPQDLTVEQFISSNADITQSNHEEGRSVALFDGSAHALDHNTPADKLRKLVLINDGEIVRIND